MGRREDLAFFRPVDANGRFTEEIEPWFGQRVKEADPNIIRHLKEQGSVVKVESYSHDYPFHDLCDSALIYYPTPSWFIKTS